MLVVMNIIAAPLETESAPYGIVSFELAGSAARAEQITGSWDETMRLQAAFSLGLDYLFLIIYSSTIGLACIMAAAVLQIRHWPLVALGVALAWGLWLAAILDAVENAGLAMILFGGDAPLWAPIARWCAVFKFGLIFAGICYLFFGLVVNWVIKPAVGSISSSK